MIKKITVSFLIAALALTSILPLSAQEDMAAYIILSSDTGQILLEKDSTKSTDASLLIRMMICFLTIKNFDLEQELQTDYGFEPLPGSDYNFDTWSSFRVSRLLKLAILSCDTNAVYVMALSLAKNSGELAAMMNKEAESIGLADTHFAFSETADIEYSHTTLKDTAIFLSAALQNPTFKDLYCMQAAILESDGVLIKNKNKMVLSAGVSKNTGGMISPFSEENSPYMTVSFCSSMVSTVNSTALNLIFVADHLEEAAYESFGNQLLSGVVNSFYRIPAVNSGDILLTVPLGNETLNLVSQSTAYCIMQSGVKNLVSQITFTMDKGYDIVELQPPVSAGTKLGTAHILLYDNTTIDVPIAAGNSIFFKNEQINNFYTTLLENKQLLILVGVLIGLELLLLAAKLYKHFH